MSAVLSGIRPIVSHGNCYIRPIVTTDAQVFFPYMTYTRHGLTTVRHPMETGEPRETIKETLNTGVSHEMAKDQLNFEFWLLFPKPIYYEFGRDQHDPDGTHLKAVFVIATDSPLRDYDLPDGDAVMGPISMMEAEEYLRLTEGKTVAFHSRATIQVLGAIAESDSEVFGRYWHLLTKYERQVLRPDQKAAIAAYPGKW